MLICILKAGYTEQFAGNSCNIKKGEDGRILGANKLLITAKLATDNGISVEPVLTFSRFDAGWDNSSRSPSALRAPVRAGSITGVRVINGFPPFICDFCE